VELASNFVPAADEVARLQTGKDPECRLFQKIAEQGHYGGRTFPSTTRQGTYAATPSGVLLASVNSNDPTRIAAMLTTALEKWKTLPAEQRFLAEDPQGATSDVSRQESLYPKDGLVLRVNSRDLPRDEPPPGWRANAWNQDFAWFTKDEARQFLPEQPEPGQKRDLPDPLIRRIARCSLVDNVRGQTRQFDEPDVKNARLTAEVVSVEGGVVTLRLEGETRTEAEGTWSIAGYRDMNNPTPQKRGFEMRLLGNAKYDLNAARFTTFEMVALGTRWGATQYNGRDRDVAPAPIGFAFTLAGDTPAEHVAPAHLGAYGWQK
jgi:hypothetical protein